jgi:hypothetical protein
MEYIRETYNVYAKRGMQIIAIGKPGIITGSTNEYLRVRLNGEKKSRLYHPTYQIEYLDRMGEGR